MTTASEDNIKAMKDAFLKAESNTLEYRGVPTQQHLCPHCGYCPHCGRGTTWPVYPTYPAYPAPVPTWPWWQQPNFTYTCNSR